MNNQLEQEEIKKDIKNIKEENKKIKEELERQRQENLIHIKKFTQQLKEIEDQIFNY